MTVVAINGARSAAVIDGVEVITAVITKKTVIAIMTAVVTNVRNVVVTTAVIRKKTVIVIDKYIYN